MFNVQDQFSNKVPFVSLVCWRNKYQSYIDKFLRGRGSPSSSSASATSSLSPARGIKFVVNSGDIVTDPNPLLIIEEEVRNAKLFPGTVLPVSNKCIGIKPTEEYAKTRWNEADDALKEEEERKKNNNNNNNNINNDNDNDVHDDNKVETDITSEKKSLLWYRSRNPEHLCTLWPIYEADEDRGQQLFMSSDIVVVLVNHDASDPNDKTEKMQKYLTNRILPLLIVATSRTGVEPFSAPLHCVLLNEEDGSNQFFFSFCRKVNSQQRKLNLSFSTLSWRDVDPEQSRREPMEVILDLVKETHMKLLVARGLMKGRISPALEKSMLDECRLAGASTVVQVVVEEEKTAAAQQQEKKESHVDPNTTTNAADDGEKEKQQRTSQASSSSPSSSPFTQKQKEDHSFATTTEAKNLRTFSLLGLSDKFNKGEICLIVRFHDEETARFYLQFTRNESPNIFLTCAKCPHEAVSQLVSVRPLFSDQSLIASITLRPLSSRIGSSFMDMYNKPVNLQIKHPTALKIEEANVGVVSVGSIWGLCSSSPSPCSSFELSSTSQQEKEEAHNNNNNKPEVTIPTLTGFEFHSCFPSSPQLLILRIPKLPPRFARSVNGGQITLVGFGGAEMKAEVVAIASTAQRRLMDTVGKDVIGSSVYYACFLGQELSPLYLFDRPWCRLLVTGANCLRGQDEYIDVCSAEVMYSWRHFDVAKKMMRIVSSNENSNIQSRVTFTNKFEFLQSHDDITRVFIDRIFGPSCNDFLSTETFNLPIAVSDESTSEDSIVHYLFSFKSGGFPGSGDDIKNLGKSCIRCLMNDLFGDMSLLVRDVDRVAFASDNNQIANWLFVRRLQRANEGLSRGAICLMHFVMLAEAKIRDLWATVNAAKESFSNESSSHNNNNDDGDDHAHRSVSISATAASAMIFLKKKRERMGLSELYNRIRKQQSVVNEEASKSWMQKSIDKYDEKLSSSGGDSSSKNSQNNYNNNHHHFSPYGDPGSFIVKLLTRLRILPYLMTATSKWRVNFLEVPPIFQSGMTSTSSTASSSNTSTNTNLLLDLIRVQPLVGWNTSDPIHTVETWALNVVACVSCRWQLEVAVSKVLGHLSDFDSLKDKAEQMLPMMFFANGMDGVASLYLPRAYKLNAENRVSGKSVSVYHPFEMKNIMTNILRYSSISFFSSVFERMQRATEQEICLKEKEILRKGSTILGTNQHISYQHQNLNQAVKDSTLPTGGISELLKTGVLTLSSVPAGYKLIAAPFQGKCKWKNIDFKIGHSVSAVEVFSLNSLIEVFVFETISDPKTKISAIPIHLLWKIAKRSQV